MALFALCVLILIATTWAESSFGTLSLMFQRVLTFLGFVLPTSVDCVLGVMSFVRREGPLWLAAAAIVAIVLNDMFAAFHLLIVFYAG